MDAVKVSAEQLQVLNELCVDLDRLLTEAHSVATVVSGSLLDRYADCTDVVAKLVAILGLQLDIDTIKLYREAGFVDNGVAEVQIQAKQAGLRSEIQSLQPLIQSIATELRAMPTLSDPALPDALVAVAFHFVKCAE